MYIVYACTYVYYTHNLVALSVHLHMYLLRLFSTWHVFALAGRLVLTFVLTTRLAGTSELPTTLSSHLPMIYIMCKCIFPKG